MFEGKLHFLKIAGLLAGFGTPLFAGDFAAPAEGPVAFRRDQVPLDVETMAGLSQQLATLADGLDAKTAADRRGVAQMLALAVALDPANSKARGLIDEFTAGTHKPDADAGKLETFRTRIRQYIAWLEMPEAGSQGKALAACLKDVLDRSDPKGSRATGSESGAWSGWIPPLAAYEAKAVPTPEETIPAEAAAGAPPLASATVETPLWKMDPDSPGKWVLKNASLTMSAVKLEGEGAPPPFALTVGASEGQGPFVELSAQIIKLLQKQHESLPLGIHVTLDGDGLATPAASKKNQSFGAAAAVLASAAVTGREPGEVTILGTISATGAYTLTPDFWTQLQSLGPGTGGRLVLPAAAAEYLPSLLVLERPQLFMDYEILLAANFKELLDLTAKESPEALAKVSTQFREIREKGASQPLGQYVANPFIRRRFAEIVQEVPYHASAKMLALQGAGNRPTFVMRSVLVAELRHAIEPMEWLTKHTGYSFEAKDTERFDTTYETCRAQVDGLLRYADKGDRELVSKVQGMVTAIRTLDRAAKSRGYTYEVQETIAAAQTALLRSHKAVAEELAREAGDVEEIVPVK